MDLIARLKAMWRRHDERLLDRSLEERATGVQGDNDASLYPGLDRVIVQGADRHEEAAEHGRPVE
jgi:hypothetical protein